MLLAELAEPVDVWVIGEHHWYEPFLVPLAVILAGLLAAWLSWLIFKRGADADDRRLRRRFAHERELREREATREVLDEVIADFIEINQRVGRLAAMVATANRLKREADEAEAAGTPDLERYRDSVIRAMEDRLVAQEEAGPGLVLLPALTFRLRLRFPESHPVVQAFDALTEAVSESNRWVQEAGADFTSGFEDVLDNPHTQIVSDRVQQFLAAARDWHQSVPDAPGSG